MHELVYKISQRLMDPLPGPNAQYAMAPSGRKEFVDSVKDYTPAAVLNLIYPKFGEAHMVFIQRTAHEKDKHSSQIAFPGGKAEPQDPTMVDTALREAQEEIGLNLENVQVLGELTPLKIPVSRFKVFPVLAVAKQELSFIRQVSEVERIIEIPLRQILDPKFKITKEISLGNGIRLKDVPIFNFDEGIIWGATSMMLNETIELLK